MNPAAAVAVKNLHFAYNGHTVFSGANLLVEQGDFSSIVGPNGGGKTTLLKLLLGLLRPTQGTVRVLGGSPESARPRVGYLPQKSDFDPFFPINVLDVVLTGRLSRHRWFGRYNAVDRAAAHEALAEVGLVELAGRAFGSLSGGQRQRALIARAMVGEPELLLLDEPAANLDPRVEREFYQLLRRLNERLTILIVSHDLAFVSEHVRTVVCVNRDIVVHPTGDVPVELIGERLGAGKRLVKHDVVDHFEGGG